MSLNETFPDISNDLLLRSSRAAAVATLGPAVDEGLKIELVQRDARARLEPQGRGVGQQKGVGTPARRPSLNLSG
jgi:hypothetical protein